MNETQCGIETRSFEVERYGLKLTSQTSFASEMKKDEKDQNIEVVVRVRPRNDREIKENAHVVVETEGNQLTVKQDFEKTFSFDHVFGPTDSQEKVFNAVVLNMISEVLMGYNCTIFAYGQVDLS